MLAYRTGQGNQREYELLYNGQGRQGEPFYLGLAEIDSLLGSPPQVRNDQNGMPLDSQKTRQRRAKVASKLAAKTASNR